jgi:hypothetical protein
MSFECLYAMAPSLPSHSTGGLPCVALNALVIRTARTAVRAAACRASVATVATGATCNDGDDDSEAKVAPGRAAAEGETGGK